MVAQAPRACALEALPIPFLAPLHSSVFWLFVSLWSLLEWTYATHSLHVWPLVTAARHYLVSAHHRHESNAGRVKSLSCRPQPALARGSHRLSCHPWISVSSSEQWDTSLTHRSREIINKAPYRVSVLLWIYSPFLLRGSYDTQACLKFTLCI